MAAYLVNPGGAREEQYARKAIHAQAGRGMEAIASISDELKSHENLVIVFGAALRGEAVRQLVNFGDTLGIPVKYVCLVDYSNSRGAMDMGLVPELLPGYHSVRESAMEPGLALDEMIAAKALDALWVVGANPLESCQLASDTAFVVVQDLFLTETARRADVVLPAQSAYEKGGTVTSVTGEVQRLKVGARIMGTKSDLEIMGLIAKEMGLDLGIWSTDKVFDEIRRTVRGYSVAVPVIASGGAAQTTPLDGRVPAMPRPEHIHPSGDTLFTSGTLGRYSKRLSSVMEAPGELFKR